jgi:hypothetical protein
LSYLTEIQPTYVNDPREIAEWHDQLFAVLFIVIEQLLLAPFRMEWMGAGDGGCARTLIGEN